MRGVNLQQPNPYLAALLDNGAAGYAADAAGILIERRPDLTGCYGTAAFSSWRGHFSRQLIELAAALAVGEPALFAAQLIWMRHVLAARAQPDDAVDSGLDALDLALSRRLPESVRAACGSFVGHARSQLRAAPTSPVAAAPDPTVAHDRHALAYLNQLLDSRGAAAIDRVISLADSGLDVTAIYRDVLLPAQREVGRRWHLGLATIAEEHLVTEATCQVMARLSCPATGVVDGRTVVAAAVAGNAHDIGLRAVAEMYRLAGWRVHFLGADVPERDLSDMLSGFGADLLLLGATLGVQVRQAAETIRLVREGAGGHTGIVVGGAAFDAIPGLWRRIGADGYAISLDDVVAVGERLADRRTGEGRPGVVGPPGLEPGTKGL